jgi:reactive chlorine resistance protein C
MGERAIHARLESIGVGVSRYGLVVVLMLIGLLKFTPPEAAGIQPLVLHSPLMSWMYAVLSIQAVSNVIGFIEIATALLIAARPFSPKASFVGSLGAVVTFLLTISFLFSTPGAFQQGHGISILGEIGGYRSVLDQGSGLIGRLMLDSRRSPSCCRKENRPAV